ncbi:MAG: hypothetical protein HFE77_05865 [Clostridiales bacterium]|nr:hypothetical protein [Clostridiales bacterium]
MKITKFSIWFMVLPALLRELLVNPLYQYISYLDSYQDEFALAAAVLIFDILSRLLSVLVLFAAAAGILVCMGHRPKRRFLIPAGFYLLLLAMNKGFAYLTTYVFTVLGKNNFTLSMLRSMHGDLFRLSLQDFVAGAVYMALFSLIALAIVRLSEKMQRIWITVCYLVLQMGSAVYLMIVNVMAAGSPASFWDFVSLLWPFVRIFVLSAAGYLYVKRCTRFLNQKLTGSGS